MWDTKTTSKEKARLIAYAAQNKKALDPVILDLQGYSDFTDYFVITSGNTDVHVRSIHQEIDRVCHEEGISIMHTEGAESNTWMLLDMGDVVVHIFRQEEREFYNLEQLWEKAKRVSLSKL